MTSDIPGVSILDNSEERDTKGVTMAVFVPVTNVARVSLEIMLMGQKCANIFHFRLNGGYDVTSLDRIGDLVNFWYIGQIIPYAPTDLSYLGCVVTDLTTSTSPAVECYLPTPQSGQGNQASLPGNVTFCVTWKTGLRGRSFRGRTYHVGLRPGLVTGNTITNDAVTFYTDAYGQIMDDTSEENFELVVVSKFEEGEPRTTGIATPVTTWVVNNSVDSQRRRLAGRGE